MSKTDDAIAYLQAQYEQEWEQELIRVRARDPLFFGGHSRRFQKIESEFNRNTKRTPAMLAAIDAIQKFKIDR